jgi:medium-chain acyl-[acyl-carrier-protein] hydrolase
VTSRALHMPRPRPDAAVTAYAVAHAGAGAAVWNAVAAALPESVELRAVRLPGRENRITAPPHRSIRSAAEEIAAAVTGGCPDRPALLVGSCSGALVALAAAGLLPPGTAAAGLVVVRQPVPAQLPGAAGADLSTLDSAGLRSWLRDNQLTPAALLDDTATFEFFEPLLRADLCMVDGFAYAGPALRCPVFLLRAPGTPQEPDPPAWQRVTSGPVRVVDVPVAGDPLTAHPAEFAAVIGAIASQIGAST